jgi:cytochrome P450
LTDKNNYHLKKRNKVTNLLTPQTGFAALKAFLQEGSPLGPMRVMAAHIGRFFRIPLPGFNPYVVHGPEAARRVLVTERQKLHWRNPDPVTDLLRQGVLVTDGQEHDHYRSLMEPSLHPRNLGDYAQMMIYQTDRVSAGWQDGQTIDMLVEGRKIALLIIMQALFSVDAWDDLSRLWTPILKAIEFISPGPWLFWRHIPRPGYKKHIKILDDYLYQIIEIRRKSPPLGKEKADGEGPDLLQHLLDAGLDNERIRDQMLTMLIAGHDTSTALLAWTFTLLGQHPEIFSRLVGDLDEAIGQEAPSKPGGWQPPLLDQVIKEALRLYPPIHMGNRIAAEPMDFDDQCVQAGDRLVYSIYLTQRDPEIWEDASQFCPARFERGRKTPPMSYIPFGGGPRSCIGAAFGQAEARLVIARLLQTFEFRPLNPDQIRPHMGATLEPRPGVLMQVTRRK